MNKIAIIGCGNVGMSYAYALVNSKTNVDELVLIDVNKAKAEGEAMDLNHTLPYAPNKLKIYAGDYSDCANATIVCIAAGANQNPGETRMDLINKNSVIFKEIVTKVVNSGFNGIFLIATNPLDVMTYLTWRYSGFDYSRVIGSGTSLDTARLRYLIGDRLNINPKNVHAYVIGEHGDSEFVPWSNANIGGQNITNFIPREELEDICHEVRQSAYEIINRKGNTSYGIGISLVRITNAILDDENSIIAISTYDKDNDLFVGCPAIINRNGVAKKIYFNLNEDETNHLQKSIDIIKEAIRSLN